MLSYLLLKDWVAKSNIVSYSTLLIYTTLYPYYYYLNMKQTTIMDEMEEDNTRPVSIPNDIISEEILTRLPVKSLTRFRSVSTRWNSTITHPSFSKSHFSHSYGTGADVTLILTFINRFNSERTIFSVTIPMKETRSAPNPTHILTIPGFAHPFVSQSLNGLICFNLGAMCVCNPSTRKFVKLPWTQTETANNSSRSMVFTRHRANAFGFDPVTNTHKVLDTWITCEEDKMIMEHRVFTVGAGGSNKWRRIDDGPEYFPFNECICIKGQIYFRAFPTMIASEKPVLVAFDVGREHFRFISMCNDVISNSEEAVLMELDGHLTIVDHQGEDNVILMTVLMYEENKEWVKKRVEIPPMYSEMIDRKRFKFAGTAFSGEMIFAERSLVKPFCVFFYDIKKNEAKKVEICDFDFSYSSVLMNVASVNEHVESIKSLT